MRKAFVLSVLAAVLVTALAAPPASANPIFGLEAPLLGFNVVPAVNTAGRGRFSATVPIITSTYPYQLRYHGLVGQVTEAHIHFAQPGVNGGVMFVLCSNLSTAPAGTPACPAGSATVAGTLSRDLVIGGAAGQGIAAGDFSSFFKAISAGNAYVDIHTDAFPGGELRGPIDEFTIVPD